MDVNLELLMMCEDESHELELPNHAIPNESRANVPPGPYPTHKKATQHNKSVNSQDGPTTSWEHKHMRMRWEMGDDKLTALMPHDQQITQGPIPTQRA